ncbi:MAG TPA: S53 family peptidase [Lapillicoccus sp.]|nr:S53 family peptidase [Lapillicoccus sp.]
MSLPTRAAVAVLGVAAVSCALVGAASSTAAASPGNGKSALAGSVPSWARAAHKVGASDKNTQVDFRVYLNNRGGDAAQQLAMAVSTPGSKQYGKFLTADQYRAQFAPAQSDVDAVSSWLKSQGFAVGYVPANHKYVEAVGSVAQASSAFGTTFSDYTVQGQTLRSNDSSLQVPSSLGNVQAVIGLDDSMALVKHDASPSAPPSTGFRNAQPCSAYWGEKTVQNTPTPDGTVLPASPSAFAPCGYAGAQLQGAYGVTSAIASGNDGSGVTVAVIDAYASPTAAADLATYSQKHGLAAPKLTEQVAPGTYTRPQNTKQDPQGWYGEETLDLEAVHTMAPGANILFVSAPNNYRDLDAALNKVVDSHSAQIITNSYGYGGEALPTGYIKPQLDAQIQAAATGISVFFSSGDDGDETGGVAGAAPTPDWPASSPFVTAVGGTSLGVTQANARLFELGWETAKSTLTSTGAWSTPAYLYGGGGGTSRLFAQPSYQAGVVPASISQTYGGAPMRVVPDVAALGDPTTGMAVGQTQTFSDGAYYDEYRIGGTSLASPLYAGLFALAVQKHGAYGLANPALYAAQGTSYDVTKAQLATYPGAVRVDFTNSENASAGYTYSARWFDRDDLLTIHVRPGYDDVTGVGAPNGTAWLSAIQSFK